MFRFLIFLFILLCGSNNINAKENIKYINSFNIASLASKNIVPRDLLLAIALTENPSFNKSIVRINTNKTLDIGVMQINDIVRKEFAMSRKDMFNPTKNILTATAHLKRFVDFKKGGLNWYNIGKYHSKTPTHKLIWVKKVKANLKRINPHFKIPGLQKCIISEKEYKAKGVTQ